MLSSSCLLHDALNHFFSIYPNVEKESTYAVAVSGGPDSMALLHALSAWGAQNAKNIHVLTVDHGLREAAKQEAIDVASWVKEHEGNHVQHKILTWEGDKPTSAVLEEARDARYDLLAQYCTDHDIQTLFVAHHQDDQAETFLIRLSKGSGLDGLAGMDGLHPFREGLKIARPFLDVTKDDLIDYCTHHHVSFASDPTNDDTHYLRPRLRQSMAILQEEGLTAKRLSTLSRRLRRARTALEEITEEAYKRCLLAQTKEDLTLDVEVLKNETEEIAFRVFQKAVLELRGRDGYGVRMERLENLFYAFWQESEMFKPRTLGGLLFALKGQNKTLYIEKE